ncbi:MAG: hypothetical protein V4773_05115 [Verrucomicrobiota bacterium]
MNNHRMTMTKAALCTAAFLLIAIGAGGFAGFHARAANRLRADALEAERRAAVREDAIVKVRRGREDAIAAERALREELAALDKNQPAQTAAKGNTASPRQGFDINLFLLERPELRALYEASVKAAEMEQYGWLMAALTPEQADRFVSERLRHDRRLSEIAAQARGEGWPREDPRRVALRRTEAEVHARELGGVLGEARLREYQEHEALLRPRNFVAGELATQLFYTDAPLTPAQAQAVTLSVARHGADARGRFDFDAVKWEAVIADARGVLAPVQLERLVNLAEARRLQSEILALQRTAGARADGR